MLIPKRVVSERLNRAALSARWKAVRYKLGAGGYDPSKPIPDGALDCSGYIAYILGMSRHQAVKRKPWSRLLPWIETTLMVRSLRDPRGPFTQVEPQAGAIIVYGDRNGKQGHVALVTSVFEDPRSGARRVYGSDCSPANYRAFGSAVHSRDITFMDRVPGRVYVTLKQDLEGK